tara:strand:+ start:1005 stop:2030 length:1026 start_codon:yes stop_codon:yes gene_type:complete
MDPIFKQIKLKETDYFRAIVLYGRNVASYKFALAEALFEVSEKGENFIPLEDLAIPFSASICRHLLMEDKQSISKTSKFLDTLREFNKGNVKNDQKIESTMRMGFTNVIDAFHVVGNQDVPIRFFHDERKKSSPGIRLTDDFLKLSSEIDSKDLIKENESRWRLVETAWAYNLPQRLVTVNYDENLNSFYAIDNDYRRHNVTSAAPALNGYQRGKCFYCNKSISLENWTQLLNRGEVDHFFPHVLKRNGQITEDLDQAWNLVLACNECNGASEKRDLCPDISYVYDLHRRNENWIRSHHPLRESIIARTGNNEVIRRNFLQSCYNIAKTSLVQTWKTEKSK